MARKLIIGILIFLLIGYAVFIQYNDFNYDRTLNKLVNQKVQLAGNYNKLKKELDKINKRIIKVDTEKADIQKQTSAKQTELNRVNNDINAIMAKINKQREAQAKYNIANGNGTKVAYLTFDDGPSVFTSRVLDILKEYGVKATFFVNGRSDTYSLNMYRRIVNEGHAIGNHTYSHKYGIVYSSIGGFDYDFNLEENLIESITGVHTYIMRFPGGSNNTVSESYNKGIMNTLTVRYRQLGYQYFDWNVSGGDSGGGAVTTASVTNNVLNGCKRKTFAVILMHDSKGTTPSSLENIIITLANSGFRFASLTPATYAIHFK